MTKLAQAIKDELSQHQFKDSNYGVWLDVGTILEDAFSEAGYQLECHNRGIHGTTLIATIK